MAQWSNQSFFFYEISSVQLSFFLSLDVIIKLKKKRLINPRCFRSNFSVLPLTRSDKMKFYGNVSVNQDKPKNGKKNSFSHSSTNKHPSDKKNT